MVRKALHVCSEVCLNLALGFAHEPKTCVIAEASGKVSNTQRARIPYRIEKRGALAQLLEPFTGPGKMVGLFPGRRSKEALQRRVLRCERVAFVERLRANLAHVVHPHERTRELPFALGEPRHLLATGWEVEPAVAECGRRCSKGGLRCLRQGPLCRQCRTEGRERAPCESKQSVAGVDGPQGLPCRGHVVDTVEVFEALGILEVLAVLPVLASLEVYMRTLTVIWARDVDGRATETSGADFTGAARLGAEYQGTE